MRNDFIQPQKIKSIITSRYEIKKSTISNWFSSKEVQEEILVSKEKCIFSNGVRIKSETISPNGNRSITEYLNGLESEKRLYNENNVLLSIIKRTYGSNKKISYYEEKDCIKGIIKDWNRYEYNNNNDLICFQSHNYERKYSYSHNKRNGYDEKHCSCLTDGSSEIRLYDEDKIIREEFYDNNKKLIKTIEHIYDENGLEINRIFNGTRVERYLYDIHRNTIYMKWWREEYDSRTSSNKEIETETTYDYKYDSYGNWVELRQYRNKQYNLLETREIEYL